MNRAASPQAIFSAAEQAFSQGRYEDARRSLLDLVGTGLDHPAVHHLRALVERRLGNLEEASRAFRTAEDLAPHDPQISNNHGNLLGDLGDHGRALAAYDRALALEPEFAEAAINRAITLSRLKDYEKAGDAFRALSAVHPSNVRLWNAIGAMERDAGDLAAAAAAYDRALALQPRNALAARGRARVSLERGEGDAIARYTSARSIAPNDRELIMEEAEARIGSEGYAALDTLADTVRSCPDWCEGQLALARLRWEAGDAEGFTADLRSALAVDSRRADLWVGLIDLLSNAGLKAEAADAARAAHAALGGSEFALGVAIYASRAGELDSAEEAFASLPSEFPGRAAHESGFRIRTGDLERAAILIDRALVEDPANIGSWALAELIYRATGDPRSHWLSGQEGLVRPSTLNLDESQLHEIRQILLGLHANSAELLGQSVRDGTQTRGGLFNRPEPELAALRHALEMAIADYVAGLPSLDESHPLLRHRATPLAINGSWSVRLTGSGHHFSHFHPRGLISSACYFIVPETAATSQEGWLELGRPPPDLGLDLEPLVSIQPKEGRLVLFPSYLHHGTRPFSAGERMSVAFDISTI